MHILRRKLAPVSVALLLAFAFGACQANHADEADQIFQAFASGCQSAGDWTQTALAQTRALEGILQSLQAADHCQGAATALSSVQSLSGEIQRLSTDPNVVNEKTAEEEKRQLLIELSTATDPDQIKALVDALAQSEVTLAHARANSAVTADQQGNTALTRGLTQMSGYLGTLLSSQTNLESCSAQHPLLGLQLGAGVLAIAGTFVNPVVGSAISAAGQILTGVIDFARRAHLEAQLHRVQGVELEAGLACGLESLSNTYCQAQDMYTLAKLQADSYPAQWAPTPFWAGLDLWSRKVPRLLAWISKLASGVEPSDPSSADRQNQVWAEVHALQGIQRTAEGIIAQTERLLGSPPQADVVAPNWQDQITRHALAQLVNTMYGDQQCSSCPSSSPISQYYTTRVGLLYKLAVNSAPPEDQNLWRTVDTIDIPAPPKGFIDITNNTRAVFLEVSQQLLANLHLVIDVDPSGLLRDATQPDIVGQEAVIDVVADLVRFLDDSAAYFQGLGDPESLQMIPLIRETQKLLSNAASSVLTAPGTPEGDRAVVTQLFGSLNLIYGSDFLSGRLYRHIKWDLNSRIEHGQFPEEVAAILRASGRDAARELTGQSASSLDQLNLDISNGQSASQRNLENFVALFGGDIDRALKRLREAADRAGEPLEGPHRPNRMMQARICTLLISTTAEWPKGVHRQLCEDAVLESIYPGITEKLRFRELEDLFARLPLEQKMCTYQRFLRRSRLFATKPPGL